MSEGKSEKSSLLFTLDSSASKIYQQDRDYLLGRLLTVIDALGLKPEQGKSVKDLIHSAFFEYRERHQKLVGELFERLYEAEGEAQGVESDNRLPSIINK